MPSKEQENERQAATDAANAPPPQPATGFVQPKRRLSVEEWRAEERQRREHDQQLRAALAEERRSQPSSEPCPFQQGPYHCSRPSCPWSGYGGRERSLDRR